MILSILSGLGQIPEADLIKVGQGDVEPGEEVVGVLPLDLRRLYTVYRKQAELVLAKTKKRPTTRRTMGELMAHARELDFDTEGVTLLRAIFWREVQQRFGANGKSIAIRKGEEVVIMPPEVSKTPAIVEGVIIAGCDNPDCEGCKRLRSLFAPLVPRPSQN